MKKNIYQIRGFTLIELLLYVAILSIFVTGALVFSFDVMRSQEKTVISHAVEQNARFALQRITHEINSAIGINSVTATQISLVTATTATNPTIITLSSGAITLQQGSNAAVNLTSNQVRVSALTFTNLSSSNNNTKNIQVSLTVDQAQTGVRQEYTATTTMTSAGEIKSMANQASALQINATAAVLASSNLQIQGITIQNVGSTALTIDRMQVTWSGGTGGSVLQNIRINNVDVFTGSAVSGTNSDITNTTLSVGAAAMALNRLTFSLSMANSFVTIRFIMSDGSTKDVDLRLVALTPSPTLTPTLTPVPTNCQQHCQYVYGSSNYSCTTPLLCGLGGGTNTGIRYECNGAQRCCCN